MIESGFPIPTSALIFIAPELTLELYRLGLAGSWNDTVPIVRRIAGFFRDVLGPLFAKGYTDAALDKAMAEASGLLLPFGPPRPPYRPLSDEDYRAMRTRMLTDYPEFVSRTSA